MRRMLWRKLNYMYNRDNRIKIKATMFPCDRATQESVGYDLRCSEDFVLDPGAATVASTGVFIDMPADTFAMVCSRSGLAAKGIFVVNAPGIIDPDYKDEIKVILATIDGQPKTFAAGDKIAQLVFSKTLLGSDIAVGQRTGGLGSTGK